MLPVACAVVDGGFDAYKCNQPTSESGSFRWGAGASGLTENHLVPHWTGWGTLPIIHENSFVCPLGI